MSAEGVMLRGPASQEEMMNCTGAFFSFLTEEQLKTHTQTNTQGTEPLN